MPGRNQVVKGYLQLKKKTAVKDSWNTYLCEFEPKTRQLTVKSKEDDEVFWQKVIEKAWPLEPRPNRRENRFDVLSVDGITAAFAAPKAADMKAWLDALEKTDVAEPVAEGSAPEMKDLTEGGSSSAAGATKGSEAFEIAGDEADDPALEVESTASGSSTLQLAVAEPPVDEADINDEDESKESKVGFFGIGQVVRWLSMSEEHKPATETELEAAAAAKPETGPIEDGTAEESKAEEESKAVEESKPAEETKPAEESKATESKPAGVGAREAPAVGADGVICRIYEAPDGFRGTYDEVVAYEKKMNFVGGKATAVTGKGMALADDGEEVLFKLYEAPDGFRGSHAEVLAYEQKMGFDMANPNHRPHAVGPSDPNDRTVIHLYEAPDGFRGTYDEVLAHEERIGVTMLGASGGPDDPNDPLIIKLYEAPDGFRGTYDEVQAYESTMHFDKGPASDPNDLTILKLYEAPDGFRGTYEEVAAYEESMGFQDIHLGSNRNDPHDSGAVILRLYECSDGFRGTYEECKRHEVEHMLPGDDDGPGHPGDL